MLFSDFFAHSLYLRTPSERRKPLLHLNATALVVSVAFSAEQKQNEFYTVLSEKMGVRIVFSAEIHTHFSGFCFSAVFQFSQKTGNVFSKKLDFNGFLC